MKSLCLLLVAFGCVGMISTYQCYTCTSVNKASCGDPFDANAMTTADKTEANADEVCLTTTVNNIINRTAGPRSTCLVVGLENGYQLPSLPGFKTTISYCTSNLCNGVSTVSNGVSTVSNDVSTVSNGVSTVSNGVSTVSNDVSTVSNGVSTVSNGVSIVSNGVSTVSNDVSTVSNGVSTVSNGVSTVSNGVSMVQNQPFCFTTVALALVVYRWF